MNLLHNKARNRTALDRMDKLQFIYINARVLSYKIKRPSYSSSSTPGLDGPDGSNKRRKTEGNAPESTRESWLNLDNDTELAVEDEYRPQERIDVSQDQEKDESDIEPDEDQGKEPPKASSVYSLLQGEAP